MRFLNDKLYDKRKIGALEYAPRYVPSLLPSWPFRFHCSNGHPLMLPVLVLSGKSGIWLSPKTSPGFRPSSTSYVTNTPMPFINHMPGTEV